VLEKGDFCSEVGRFSPGNTPDHSPDSTLVSEKYKGEAHKEGEGGYTATTTGTDTVPKPRSKRESRPTEPLKQDELMLTLTQLMQAQTEAKAAQLL